jgi:hypothetical protein
MRESSARPARRSRTYRAARITILALFAALASTLALWREAEPIRLRMRLNPMTGAELWQLRCPPPRRSSVRFAALDATLAEAHRFMASGRLDRSLLEYQSALQHWGEHPLLLAGLGRLYLAERDRPKLRRILRRLESLEPSLTWLRLLQAEEQLLAGSLGRARSLLEPLQWAGAPVQARARLFLAALAVGRGERELARRLVDSVREAELDLADSRSAYRRLLKSLGEPASDANGGEQRERSPAATLSPSN